MKTFIIIRKSDLAVLGNYQAEQKDDTSATRNYAMAEPLAVHLELPGDLNAECVDAQMSGDDIHLVRSDAKEAIQLENAWSKLRMLRDNLLAETDKYLLVDFPISAENLQHMKDYRNALRDMPSQVADPRQPYTFPAMPNV